MKKEYCKKCKRIKSITGTLFDAPTGDYLRKYWCICNKDAWWMKEK